MFNRIYHASAAFIAALALSLGVALAAAKEGDHVGKSADEITTNLTQQKYEVQEIEIKGGRLEAKVVLDDREYEIYVDLETGKIVEIEEDD